MKFKSPHLETQLLTSPQKLIDVVRYFATLSEYAGVTPVVTRVWDPVPGDSGVHEAKRGCDCRDEYVDSYGKPERLYTDQQVKQLVSAINKGFPRTDGKFTCIHHSFQGGPLHFHLQVAASGCR